MICICGGCIIFIRIRPFGEKDAIEVFNILKDAEEVHVGGLTYSEKAVRNWHVSRVQDIILVAEAEDEVVGFIASKLNDPEQGAAYVDCLIVKPEHRGKGIGQQLLNQCIAFLETRNISFVHLHVRADLPRSVNFWEKNGFKGKRPLLWMYKEI